MPRATTVELGRPADHIATMQAEQLRRAMVPAAALLVTVVVAWFAGGGRWWALPAFGAVALAGWWQVSVGPQLGRLRAGRRAENRVARTLRRARPAALLHGLDVNGRGGDADHVVLGPCAAVVETKHGRGKVSVDRQGRVVAGTKTLPRDPLGQVRRQADKVARATNLQVAPVLCVVESSTRPFEHQGVWVCSARDLPKVLGRLPRVVDVDRAAKTAEHLWEHRHR